VDEHHGVWPMMAKVAVGSAGEGEELMNVEDDAQHPHHGELGHVGVKLAIGGGHLGTAIADGLQLGILIPELANQVGAVQVAAGLAGREVDLHGAARSGVIAKWPDGGRRREVSQKRRNWVKCSSP